MQALFSADEKKLYDRQMDTPKTVGAFLEMLREKYSAVDIIDVQRASGISRSTLDTWARVPSQRLNAKGRAHYRRIFEGAMLASLAKEPPVPYAAASPSLAAIAAALARIEQRLDALMTLRADPGRLEQMVTAKSKAKKAGGGAA